LDSKLASVKFNGKIVMDITNLRNKELGKFIYDFGNYIENELQTPFKKFIINSEDSDIKDYIKHFYDNFFSY
jgi:hypothetical protein